MTNPLHPGEIIRSLIIKPLGCSVDQAARTLGLPEGMLAGILDGRSRITAEIAVRLAVATDTTVEGWLLHQALYDEWRQSLRDS